MEMKIILQKIAWSLKYFRYADQVSTGDELLVEKNGKFTPARVTNKFNLITQGTTQVYIL